MQKISDQNVEITEKMMKTGSQTLGSKPCQGFFKGGQGKILVTGFLQTKL